MTARGSLSPGISGKKGRSGHGARVAVAWPRCRPRAVRGKDGDGIMTAANEGHARAEHPSGAAEMTLADL
ncbi:MAG: hypothetical protein ABSB59_29790, partial [Streptosporangiaceae bacterium]